MKNITGGKKGIGVMGTLHDQLFQNTVNITDRVMSIL